MLSMKSTILFSIPASPGFYVLTPVLDESGAVREAATEPVVAWVLDDLGMTTPVTPREVLNADDDDHAILCPDGRVQAFNDDWPSVADWLNDQRETR